ncbi:MAG: PAS domain-containing protein [Chitinophagaceae bacterium]
MQKIAKKKAIRKQDSTESSPVSLTQDILSHLAFDNSLQPSIISTVSTGKIIMANDSACKLLGYSKKQLLTKTRSIIFDIKEASFKKMLKQRTAEGRSAATVTAIRKNGVHVPGQITSAVFKDEKGIEKAITTITDMRPGLLLQKGIDIKNEKTVADNIVLVQANQKKIDVKNKKKVADNIVLVQANQEKIDVKKEKIVAKNIVLALAKADAQLKENNEWIKYISKSSYDVMWDWDVATGKIYVGDSVKEVFGYELKSNMSVYKDFVSCLLPEEKDAVEKKLAKALQSNVKSWDDIYRLRRKDGSVASTVSRASIVRNSEGKAIRLIGAIQDISRLQELEQQLVKQTNAKNYDEVFQLAARLSYDGIWDWNLSTNDFFLGDGFDELFGYAVKNVTGSMDDWSKHLHPDDKEAVEKGLQETLASKASHWEHAYRFIKSDGSIANVFGRASIIRDENGKACRMIGSIHDLSKQEELEGRLEMEIKLKETQIAEAAEEAKDTERSDIGKELHDNVNQLLGASRMYLEMAKRGGEKSDMYLSRSSEYTLTAIEEIRKLTKGLTTDIIENLGLCEAISNTVRDMMEVNPVKISCAMESFIEGSVNHKFKLNVFRIVQEHLNNIMKHAQSTKVTLDLSQNKEKITLTISDNGIGFDTLKKRAGIGIDNIKSRASTYDGKANFASMPGHGCILTVKFSIPAKDPQDAVH